MTPNSLCRGKMLPQALFGVAHQAAIMSKDGRYRYSLERFWDDGEGTVLFVMLNPSTADASVDDPTIRRCMGFARSWGYQGLIVWNIYAYRATDPDELDRVDDPIGRENEDHLWRIFPDVDLIVAAWGAKPNRGRYVNREMVMTVGPFYDHDLYCLGLTKDGHPRHPLYVKGSTKPILWHPAGSEKAMAA